tara:strand:- start:1096 stop:1332 length:237 start_codon:yes stop_codon:yes gene_type:complete
MYNIQTLSFDMLPKSYYSKPSVYVISDSQWTEYKRQQSLSEIAELNKLIKGHTEAIERLKESRTLMEQQFSTDKQATE